MALTPIFADGFESGYDSGTSITELWPSTDGHVLSTASPAPPYGTYGLNIDTTGGSRSAVARSKIAGSTYSRLLIQFRWKRDTSNGSIFQAVDVGSGNDQAARLDWLGGGSQLQWGASPAQVTTTITDNNWHYIVLYWDYATIASFTAGMWVDGVLAGGAFATKTTTGTSPGTIQQDQLRWGYLESYAASMWWDDIVIISTDTALDATYVPTEYYVVGGVPTGVGTHNLDASPSSFFFKTVSGVDTALTTSETTSYQTIDEVPLAGDADHLTLNQGSGSPNTPAFRAAGTTAFSANNVANGTLAPGAPTGKAVGDLLLLICTSTSNAYTVTTPSGWNVVSGFPKASGTSLGGKIYAFSRIADGTATDTPTPTFASLTTGTSGTPASATILAIQNGTETLDGTVASSDLSAQTTTSVIPAFTTATNDSYVVGVAIKILESSGQTSTVATFTERVDQSTTSGSGYVLEVSDKVQTTAGSSGTATVTWSATTSARAFAVSMGFKATTAVTNPVNTEYAEYTFSPGVTVTPLGVTVQTGLRNNSGTTANSVGAKIYDGTSTSDVYATYNIGTTTTFVKGTFFATAPSGAWTSTLANNTRLRWGFSNNAASIPRLEAAHIQYVLPVVTAFLPEPERIYQQVSNFRASYY